MFCPNCGKKISDNSRFCEHCGSSVEVEDDFQTSRQKRRVSQRYEDEDTYEERPRKSYSSKKKTKKLGFIPTVLMTAVIAVGVWFVKGYLDDGEDFVYTPNNILPANPSGSSNGQSNTGNSGNSGNSGVSGNQGTQGSEDVGQFGSDNITAQLSTYERPTQEEFAWYDEVFNNGIWPDATPVTDLSYILGGWKCYIVYDPYVAGGEVRELANVELSYNMGEAYALVDWYQMFWNGEAPYDETGDPDSEFYGTYKDGIFDLSGPCTMSLGAFYEYQGKYYGFGYLIASDGTAANFWMMR